MEDRGINLKREKAINHLPQN